MICEELELLRRKGIPILLVVKDSQMYKYSMP
jgi:hypothetical protein